MIYKWERCPASDFSRASDCPSCVNWLIHLDDHPECSCNRDVSNLDSESARDKLVNLQTVTASSSGYKVICSSCGASANRDYPLYHISSDIISPFSEVPNPPKCERCVH